MTPLLVLNLLLLLPLTHSANVLVIGGVRGSRLYIPVEVARKMAEFGHDVTVLTPYNEPRVNLQDGPFRFVAFEKYDGTDQQGKNEMEKWETTFQTHALHQPSRDMMANLIAGADDAKSFFDDVFLYYLSYFNGTEFARLLEDSKFDLIVLEDSMSMAAMIPLINQKIPIIGLYCGVEAKATRDRFGLPGLMNSEPNLFNDLKDDETSPKFFERFRTLKRITRFILSVMPFIMSVVEKEAMRHNRPANDYLLAVYDVEFVLDHPAFSFPFLTPPNVFHLGPFHLEGHTLDPLPQTYHDFLSHCPHRHTVLFSFGSYLQNITMFSGTPTILTTLSRMDLCVILRSEVDVVSLYQLSPEKFLQQSWLPQRDLLGSGEVDLFISHCGNNGRLESIFYNVPLLCVPLFADQYYNARLVERNGFGTLITWEALDEVTLRESVGEMLEEKADFVENMKRAVEIARNDPGTGTDVLRFYSDLLIKNGNADFLVNRIILQQWTYEIYNLDFAFLALMVFICIAVLILVCFYKICKYFLSKMFNKKKID